MRIVGFPARLAAKQIAHVGLAMAAFALSSGLQAQTPEPAATAPAYDVSTIKPSNPDATNAGSMFNSVSGRYEGTSITLRGLLGSAFGKRDSLIVGMPAWAKELHFDVQAKFIAADDKPGKKLTIKEQQAMLRKLLEDRFQLKWHMEQRELPVYELVVTKGGSKMSPPAVTDKGGGINMRQRGALAGKNCSMEILASVLSDQVQRPVVDLTGLTGSYDFTLKFTGEEAAADTDAPSLFTAIQEQLGLKLQPAKAMQEVLIIDSVSMPSAN